MGPWPDQSHLRTPLGAGWQQLALVGARPCWMAPLGAHLPLEMPPPPPASSGQALSLSSAGCLQPNLLAGPWCSSELSGAGRGRAARSCLGSAKASSPVPADGDPLPDVGSATLLHHQAQLVAVPGHLAAVLSCHSLCHLPSHQEASGADHTQVGTELLQPLPSPHLLCLQLWGVNSLCWPSGGCWHHPGSQGLVACGGAKV